MAMALAFPGKLPPPIPGLAPPGPPLDLDVKALLRILADSTYDPDGDKAAEAYSHDGELSSVVKRRLKKVFKTIDLDGNGSISFDEFRKLVLQSDSAMLGLPTCDLADIFDVVDCDGNGEINYEEFLAWLGMGSRKQKEAKNFCLEAEKREDGPSSSSSGSNCWWTLSRLNTRCFALLLNKFKPPGDFNERFHTASVNVEKINLELGWIEDQLSEKRMRAQGAARKWLADNFSLSSKVYMKNVEEIEKRSAKVADDQAKFQAAIASDPEAREVAQMAGWTLSKNIDRLTVSHGKFMQDLAKAQKQLSDVDMRITKDIAAKLSGEIFPADKVGTISAVDEYPNIRCRISSSLDVLHTEGGLLTLSVNIGVEHEGTAEDEIEEKKKRSPAWQDEDDSPLALGGVFPVGLKQSVDIVFVIDASGSMESELPALTSALSRMADGIGRDDRVSIVTFNSSAEIVLDWTEMTNKGRSDVKQCASNIRTGTGSKFIPAMEQTIKLLTKLQKEPRPFNYPRQSLIIFVAAGAPEEARDALFSAFSRRLITIPNATFSSVALGADSNASVMAELSQCCRGPFYYMPEENGLSEVMGQLWAMAKTAALADAYVVVRPLRGCAIEDVEDTCGNSQLGPSWATCEVSVTMESLARDFRCTLHFDSEAEAAKACKFDGGDRNAVVLAEDLCEPGPPGSKVKGRVLVTKGTRLLHIRRNEFNSKSKVLGKAEYKDLEFEAAEDAGDTGFDRRPAKKILVAGISTGGIELEFEPRCWNGADWELSVEVVTTEGTLFTGSRLVGYRLGVCADVETEELKRPATIVGLGQYGRFYETLKRFSTLAFSQPLVFVFEVPYMSSLVPIGSVHRGGCRQVCVRLRVPRSLEPSARRREGTHIRQQQLLDVYVAGRVGLPGGDSTVLSQRLGLSSVQVPWQLIPGQISLALRLVLTDISQDFEISKFERAVMEMFHFHQDDLHGERIDDDVEDAFFLKFNHVLESDKVAAAVSYLRSKEGMEAMSKKGFNIKVAPTVCGRTALRRFAAMMLWRGAREVADSGSTNAMKEISGISTSILAKCLGRPTHEPEAILHAVHIDAVSVIACGNSDVDARACTWGDMANRLHGLASIHAGQYPFMPAAEAMELWETQAAWRELVPSGVMNVFQEFQRRAIIEDHIPARIAEFEFLSAESDALSFRFRAVHGNDKEITAYTVRVKDCETGEVYYQPLRAADVHGPLSFEYNGLYQIQVNGVPAGRTYAAVVYAWNGNRGLTSHPLKCSTPLLSLAGGGKYSSEHSL